MMPVLSCLRARVRLSLSLPFVSLSLGVCV
jgi:hypothetical protein